MLGPVVPNVSIQHPREALETPKDLDFGCPSLLSQLCPEAARVFCLVTQIRGSQRSRNAGCGGYLLISKIIPPPIPRATPVGSRTWGLASCPILDPPGGG